MTTKDQPTRAWLGLAEILFVYAVMLAILLFVMWEALTELGQRDRVLPLTTAGVVTVVLVYSLVTRLWSLGKTSTQEDAAEGQGSFQDTMGDTYGALAQDRLKGRHAYAIVAFTVYVLITPMLSIYLATALFVIALSLMLRVPLLAAAIGLALALAIPALFQFGLEMRLP